MSPLTLLESNYESVDIGFGSSKSAASQPMSSNTDPVKEQPPPPPPPPPAEIHSPISLI